jgi:N-acetylglutamate synthase-like GNAT family acetyltransferase
VASARVRPMSKADFPFAVALTDTERWGFTIEDFERFLALSPDGCFLVEHEGERAGLLTTMLYGELGWIGNVIVGSRLRGKHLGAALVEHAIAHLEGAGAKAVRLWAYENTVDLYAKFGFANDGFTARRWIGFGHSSHETPPTHAPKDCAVFPLNALTLRHIFPFDRRFFGSDRSRVLERVALDNPKGGLVARATDGKAVGYLLAKLSPKGCEVGPFIVDPAHADWALPCLLEGVLDKLAGQSVELGVYAKRPDVEVLLSDHGFQMGFATVRMTRGGHSVGPEDVAAVCAIGALEKG